nr:hypothetical protein [Candidatus Omnitrophota bacterium]
RDYGGTMNHLWIDLELNEPPLGRSKPWPFRFQKKVGSLSPSKLTGLPGKVYTNVGHYSVEPDFQKLRSIPLDSVPNYVLSLIYASTAILLDKQKKFAGFDAQKFRADFLTVCRQHGYPLMDAK